SRVRRCCMPPCRQADVREERPPRRDKAGRPMSFKEQLKDLVGPAWRRRVHRLSRLRWATKLQIARGLQGGDRSLRRRAAYVLWDPETESFSYELADEGELV